MYCKLSFCPICSDKKSFIWGVEFEKSCEILRRSFATFNFLWFTISPPNIVVSDLENHLTNTQGTWKKFAEKHLRKNNIGWIRFTHVKFPERGSPSDTTESANFHYHVLLFAPEGFTCDNNVIASWRASWMGWAGLDQLYVSAPQVFDDDLKYQAAKAKILYAMKYLHLWEADLPWAEEYINQMHKKHFISTGGILKNALQEVRVIYEEQKRSRAAYFHRNREEGSFVQLRLDLNERKYFFDGIYPA